MKVRPPHRADGVRPVATGRTLPLEPGGMVDGIDDDLVVDLEESRDVAEVVTQHHTGAVLT